METNWAADHLLTIRTLMERSALYRRALAPISTFTGAMGIAAAIVAVTFNISVGGAFPIYWMAVSIVTIIGALMLVRRQAVKQGENFWSPPTQRVAQAMLPALSIGLIAGLMGASISSHAENHAPVAEVLVIAWSILYGLALNSAGFFMPRGIRWFSWGFLAAGVLLPTYFVARALAVLRFDSPHLIMGLIFGVPHLAYGVYLYFTEKRKNEA